MLYSRSLKEWCLYCLTIPSFTFTGKTVVYRVELTTGDRDMFAMRGYKKPTTTPAKIDIPLT